MRAPAASSPAVRRSMLGNRRRDTLPELALRSAMHRRGLRFFVDRPVAVSGEFRGRRRRTVRPDAVFPTERVAVFLDGCMWHGCPRHGRPFRGANAGYWNDKIRVNAARDRFTDAALGRAGWAVLRFWEHQDPAKAASVVEHAIITRRELRSEGCMDYAERVKLATADQGLTDVIEALTIAGVPHSVEQTGGMVMVVYSYVDPADAESPRVGVTHEDGYFVVGYEDAEDDGSVIADGATADQVPALVRGFHETH